MSKFNFSPDDIKGVDITVLGEAKLEFRFVNKEAHSELLNRGACMICDNEYVSKFMSRYGKTFKEFGVILAVNKVSLNVDKPYEVWVNNSAWSSHSKKEEADYHVELLKFALKEIE